MGMTGLLDPTVEPDEIQSRVRSNGRKACRLEFQVFSTLHHMYCIGRYLHSAYVQGRHPPEEHVHIVQDGFL